MPLNAAGRWREAIFRDEDDRERFVARLAKACKKTGWQVLAWVLMDNHDRWLIRTPEPNRVEGMKWFQNAGTRRFNVRQMGVDVGRVFRVVFG